VAKYGDMTGGRVALAREQRQTASPTREEAGSRPASLARPAPGRHAFADLAIEPIQRAVGFEFETGWNVWDRTNIEVWSRSGKQGKPPSPRVLAKKDMVYQGDDFKVEADEAAESLAELEFIVHPPIEANEEGRKRLFASMTHMTVLGAKLIAAASRAHTSGLPLSLDMATSAQSDKKFLLRAIDNVLAAGPQVTTGITLGKIGKLGQKQGPQERELPASFSATVKQVASTSEVATKAMTQLPEDLQPGSSELHGLLTLIISYLWGGEQAVFYPKQIADVVALARTDFAKLFKLLPQNEQTYFKKTPRAFVGLALDAAGLADEPDAPVIGKVWTDENRSEKKAVGPTRAEWLFFMTQGYDKLSSVHYKEFASSYQGDPTKQHLGSDLESLGEFGEKTEQVGSQHQEAGIFELRNAATKAKIPLLQWAPFAGQVMDYLIALEG